MTEEVIWKEDDVEAETIDVSVSDIDMVESTQESSICGLLDFLRSENGGQTLVYIGIRNGPIIVNFSRNGRITSRLNTRISVDQIYRYDRNGGDVGFTCR